VCPLPPVSGGRGTLAGEKGVGRVPIPTRGIHCGTLYMYVLCEKQDTQTTVPEIIDPVFAKTSPKRTFSMTEYERFGLVFTKTLVYKFGHCREVREKGNSQWVKKGKGRRENGKNRKWIKENEQK
jgi:hypothetical protein